MKLKPHKWSHHHTHRMYHMSMAVCFVMIVLVLAAGILTTRYSALADAFGSGIVAIDGTVGTINETPSQPLLSGGGGTAFIPTETPPGLPLNITVTPSGVNFKQLENGSWQFSEPFVEFKGASNLPGALVVGDITGNATKIKFKVRTDADGSWWWRSAEGLKNGDYKIDVGLVDSQEASKASASLLFSVLSVGNKTIPEKFPTSDLGSDFNLDNLEFKIVIPSNYKSTYAGQRFASTIQISPKKTLGKPVIAKIVFVVSNESGNEVLKATENISIADPILLLKGFYTSANMPAGKYLLTATLTTDQGQLSSSDTLEIKPASPFSLFLSNKQQSSKGEYIVLSALFLFFGLLFILELKHVKHITDLIKSST